MIFRVGFLLAVSAAAFALNIKKNNDSSFQQREEEQLEEEKNRIRDEKFNNVTKTEDLSNMVEKMEERKVTLEVKLLELYSLKKRQLERAQLEKLLKAKNEEIDALNDTINVLKVETKKLIEEMKENQLAEKQMEIAKERIVEMEGKMRIDASVKGQLMVLKEQVWGFEMEENGEAVKKIREIKEVEMEAVEMKRRNKELQLEMRELTVKLVDAQARASALSSMTQSHIVHKLEEEMSSLRRTNKDLCKCVDRLQKNKFNTVEELVYQRWLNACLRFEIQNHQTPSSTQLACHLKKKLSYATQERHAPSIDSDENSTSCSYSNNQTSSNISYKNNRGLICRFSMSSAMKKKVQDLKESPEMHISTCMRRVSFNDSVRPVASRFEEMAGSVKREYLDIEERSVVEDGLNLNTNCKFNDNLEEEEVETSLVAMGLNTQDLNAGVTNVIPCESNVGDQRLHLIVAAIFFCFIITVLLAILFPSI